MKYQDCVDEIKIENINFAPKALKLIKYADIIARKGNFNAIHPVHLFLGALKIDCKISDELKTTVSVDEQSIETNLNGSIMKKDFSECV